MSGAEATGTIPARVHYREADDAATSCATCSYFTAGRCAMFDAEVSPSYVCDEWAAIVSDHALQAALPARPKPPGDVARHNRILRLAYRRVDALEPRLARLVEPILADAGAMAAAAFRSRATDHLAASLVAATDIGPASAMVALFPRPDEAARLAEHGGEDPELMHVTLAYLGEIDQDTADRVAAALGPVAGTHPPLEGTVGGVGAFADNGHGVPAIVLPDVPGLVELRQHVCAAILAADADYSTSHGYLPHATVAYRHGEEHPPGRGLIGEPLHFDHLRLVVGDRVVAEAPLTGAPALTADASPQWSSPAPDELVDAAALVRTLRTKTDPVRLALLETVMTPALEAAGLTFDVTNPLTARVLAQSGSQIVEIADTTRLNVMRIVQHSYDQGLSVPDTAKAIRAGMKEASAARATTIARTELAGAANGGSLAATQIVAQETGTAYFKQWLTAPGAPHPRHEDYDGLDGQTVQLDEPFEVGESQLQYPGDPDGDPAETINCFPAETLIEMPSLRAAMRRWYEGDLVRVRLSSGDELAGTPNHPVLRADGRWVALREVEEGDHLVSARLAWDDVGAPDPERPPAEIGETYRLAEVAGDPERVRLTPPDLHGDGADGEVEVVTLDRDLPLDLTDAACDEEVEELGLALAHAARTCAGDGHGSFGMGHGYGQHLAWSAAGGIGLDREGSALFVAHSLHTEPVRLGASARRESDLLEATHDGWPPDAEQLADREDALAALVSLAEVVEVEVEPFHGYVYNLDTGSGWYTAGTIACRNCRCTLVYTDSQGDLTDNADGVDAAE